MCNSSRHYTALHAGVIEQLMYQTCEYDRGDADSDRRFGFLFFLTWRLLLDVLLVCSRCASSSDAMCSLKSRTRSASSVIALKAASDSRRGRT